MDLSQTTKPPEPYFGRLILLSDILEQIKPTKKTTKTEWTEPIKLTDINEPTTIMMELLYSMYATSKILFADYTQIKTDFKDILNIHYQKDTYTNKEIDDFMLKYFAVVSTNVYEKDNIQILNTHKLPIHNPYYEDIDIYRPLNYGRAIVINLQKHFQLRNSFFVDIKGLGKNIYYT